MARKTRSDIQIGNLEKKLGLNSGAIRNPDGSDARSDKTLKKLREDYEKQANKKTSTSKKVTVKPATTVDEKKASKRQVKSNPKTPIALSKQVRTAIKKSTKK